MKKLLWGLFCVIVLSTTYAFFGGKPALLGQQPETVQEAFRLNQYPVTFNSNLGAATANLGEGRLRQLDTTLVEIPPGGELAPHRHLAEEMIYIVSGSGYTMMWNRTEGKRVRYEWIEGDFLSPSLNSWHQHFNASADTPARYLSITTAPLTENVFQNRDFLSSSDFSFAERWEKSVGQKPEYVGNATTGSQTVQMNVGHLLPNIIGREMNARREDVLGITINPAGDMAGNQLLEMEVREYVGQDTSSPHHRHLWETVYYALKGEGYALLQREGEPERRLNWSAGDLFIVEANEYHIHRPREGSDARILQMKSSGYFRRVGIDDYLMEVKTPNNSSE